MSLNLTLKRLNLYLRFENYSLYIVIPRKKMQNNKIITILEIKWKHLSPRLGILHKRNIYMHCINISTIPQCFSNLL